MIDAVQKASWSLEGEVQVGVQVGSMVSGYPVDSGCGTHSKRDGEEKDEFILQPSVLL